ncbi:hypothetical protein ONZ51_g5383 [Trametes cubensis]|uniref:Protein F37C4.5 n=1 Tax=Trametes cubensis TaxID=1111947 RepID=A0AAD7XC57_9APHY|nr:hypothetical protein ONZ51_g5383 [Trametes cubensis]
MFVNTISLKASSVPVKSATIFQSSTAELTRSLALELKSGRNIVEITGFSSNVDVDSPRISGAPDGVRVLDVVCKRSTTIPPDQEDETTAEIQELLEKGRALETERQVRQQEASLLDESARLVTGSGDANGEHHGRADHNQLFKFLDEFTQRKFEVQRAVQALDKQISDLGKKLAIVRESRMGQVNTVITATIVAATEAKIDLKVTYLVHGVTWRPFYDLHATSVDGQPSKAVSMRYCATIVQCTGEDWNDMTLTLSTASSQAHRQLSVPSLKPLRVAVPNRFNGGTTFGSGSTNPQPIVIQPPTQSVQANTTGLFGTGGGFLAAAASAPAPTQSLFGQSNTNPVASGFGAFGQQSQQAQPAMQQPQYMQQMQRIQQTQQTQQQAAPPAAAQAGSDPLDRERERTQVRERDAEPSQWPPTATPDRSSLSVTYRVEGSVSLPSDGKEHKLTIASLSFDTKLQYMCVPRQSPTVFIVSTVKNTSDYDLLAGVVNVFMNDSFVTKTAVGFISMNDSFACVLGVDTALKLSYNQTSKTEHEPRRNFAEPQKTTTRTVLTTITNRHPFDIPKLVVRDAIPLGNEESKLTVVLRKPVGLAETKEGQDVVVKLDMKGEGDAKTTAKVRWQDMVDGKGGEKDGLYEWVCTIPAGRKVVLEAQWDVKGPSDTQWNEEIVHFRAP